MNSIAFATSLALCLINFSSFAAASHKGKNHDAELIAAASNGGPDQVRALLQAGASVHATDGKGYTALYYAARNNQNPDVVKVLLEAGAKPDEAPASGVTPLMGAASFNRAKVARALVQAGAQVNAREAIYGATPLFYAAQNNSNADMIRELARSGADVEATLNSAGYGKRRS